MDFSSLSYFNDHLNELTQLKLLFQKRLYSQSEILSDIYIDEKEIITKIQKVEKLIKYYEDEININQKTLYKLNQKKKKKDSNTILKDFIFDVNNQILGLCFEAASIGLTDVSITAVFDIENQISQLINNLKEKNINIPNINIDHQEKIFTFISNYLHSNN